MNDYLCWLFVGHGVGFSVSSCNLWIWKVIRKREMKCGGIKTYKTHYKIL
jgi:hypothetical protein